MRECSTDLPFADIVLPVPVERIFTYSVPEEVRGCLAPGCRVLVPFGKRCMTGYVISLHDDTPEKFRTKEISKLIDDRPLLHPGLMKLAGWMSGYYVHPMGEILRTMLPAGIKGKGRLPHDAVPAGDFPEEAVRPELGRAQSSAFKDITSSIRGDREGVFLLYGVTGSGKTEVYLRCIEEGLSLGKTALVLVPEIALIPQATARFRRRFGNDVAVLHSRLTGPQRSTIWKMAAKGEVRVIIGPRSAVFVPLKDLGVIVVDEEQDPSFKQDEKPHYSAVEVAKFRGSNEHLVVILGSATPSLETYHCALSGEIESFRIAFRPAEGKLPPVDIIDMREREGIISDELLDALDTCVRKGNQAIVLIDRRGHANYVQCRKCGWIDRCPGCSISLTYHSRGHKLMCHYCGFSRRPPKKCPRCGNYRVLQKGVGTQRVEMELKTLLPTASILRMDLDTTKGKKDHLKILERFGRGDADLLLGTRMVAKGHHFPNVTVVGVLSADAGLNFPDFRAAERTFQLLSQAAGRTGRGKKGGKVIIQALAPDHYVYDFLENHDFDGFASNELVLREQLRYPPASRLMLFTISSRSREAASEAADRVRSGIAFRGGVDDADVLGPTSAVIEKLRGRYRFHLLVRGVEKANEKSKLVKIAQEAVRSRRNIELQWNVDPVNLF